MSLLIKAESCKNPFFVLENGNLNIVLKTYKFEVLNKIYAFKNTICAVEPVKRTEIQMVVLTGLVVY